MADDVFVDTGRGSLGDFLGGSGGAPMPFSPNLGGAFGSGAPSGAAGSSGFLGISATAWPWIVLGASLIGSFLLRRKKRRPPPEAIGIELTNPADANAPWIIPLGQPWYAPPLMLQYIQPGSVNTLSRSKKNRLVRVFHRGAGPLANVSPALRIAGAEIFSEVNDDSPLVQRLLTPIPNTARKRWLFPAKDVIPETVLLYLDGVLSFVGDVDLGYDPTPGDEITVGPVLAEPRMFRSSSFTGIASALTIRDDSIPDAQTRIGVLLPRFGVIANDFKFTLVMKHGHGGFKLPGSNRTPLANEVDLTLADVGVGWTNDVRQYLYVRIDPIQRSLDALVTQGWMTGIRCTYKVRPTIGFDVQVKTGGVIPGSPGPGTVEGVFSESIADPVQVTATYRTAIDLSTDQDGSRLAYTRGAIDQNPIAAEDGTSRSTFPVDLKLDAGSARRYSTSVAVDDLQVVIEADSKGFYALSKDGAPGPIRRSIQIRLKETAAADVPTTKANDLSAGWVQLKDPNTGRDFFELLDFFTGPGQWFFSAADLFAFTRDGKLKVGAANYLPPKKYDVEVTATDAASTDNKGITNTDRIFSTIYFGNVTEIRRLGFVLPGQATITLDQGEAADRDGLVECRLGGAEVVIPGTAAAIDSTTGLPTPRTAGFSRNPVWLACHFLTHEVAGGGRFFSWADIDLASAKTAADWCAETVTLRDGSTMVRSYCDIAVGDDGERRPLGEWVSRILAGSGVFAYWRGKWRFVVDQDAAVVTDPVTSGDFTIVEEDDCPPGGAEMRLAGLSEIPNELHVEFRDGENGGARTTEIILLDDPQPETRFVERVEFPAVTRRAQAKLFGDLLFRQMQTARRSFAVTGTFGRGLRLLQLDPGDIVKFTSTKLGVTALKCRVMTVGWTSGLRPAVELVEHVPAAYLAGFQGPNSAVPPGLRTVASEPPKPAKLTLRRVSESAKETVGGAA